jgi:hypothetical protein
MRSVGALLLDSTGVAMAKSGAIRKVRIAKARMIELLVMQECSLQLMERNVRLLKLKMGSS